MAQALQSEPQQTGSTEATHQGPATGPGTGRDLIASGESPKSIRNFSLRAATKILAQASSPKERLATKIYNTRILGQDGDADAIVG
jgi:hypothetical protein